MFMDELRQRLLSAKAVLFDFDGTIANLDELHVTAFSKMFEELDLTFRKDDFMKYISGKGSHDGIAAYLAEYEMFSHDIMTLKVKFDDYKNEVLTKDLRSAVELMPGVSDFLNILAKLDLSYGIVTSSVRSKVDLITNEFALGGFEFVIDRSDVINGKPDAEPFVMGMERVGYSANEIVAFEDSEYGLLSAKAAGLYTIGVLNPGWNDSFVHELSDYVIEDYKVCSDILNK